MSNINDNSGGNESGKLVCVTGASGYIASWIVKYLLERGYTVRASVRDPYNANKVAHLTALDGAKQRLQLFKADLLEQGSFDSAIDGCDGVFHTASPCFFDAKDPEIELLKPAVKGTLNILNSCAKASVKRAVLTSSIAAVVCNGKPRTPDVVVDETWFSDPHVCREAKHWYALSKTLAEEAAWEFVKENGIDMVAINPGMVIGPLLQPTLNHSCASIFSLVNAEEYPNMIYGVVNVKDVALAHILAFENASACGRYCLAERVCHFSDIVAVLCELYPTLPLPKKCVNGKLMEVFKVSMERAKNLGIEYTPLEISLRETVESFKEKQFVNF